MQLTRLQHQQTLPLRHSILRPHQPQHECVYPGDDIAGHFAFISNDVVVAILSVYPEDEDGAASEKAWRIRGVATSPEHRKKGLASALLKAAEDYVVEHGGAYLWCNARVVALSFYRLHGYQIHGDKFELPGIGDHFRMIKTL